MEISWRGRALPVLVTRRGIRWRVRQPRIHAQSCCGNHHSLLKRPVSHVHVHNCVGMGLLIIVVRIAEWRGRTTGETHTGRYELGVRRVWVGEAGGQRWGRTSIIVRLRERWQWETIQWWIEVVHRGIGIMVVHAKRDDGGVLLLFVVASNSSDGVETDAARSLRSLLWLIGYYVVRSSNSIEEQVVGRPPAVRIWGSRG